MPQDSRRWYRATRRATRESVIFDVTEINGPELNQYNVARAAFRIHVLSGVTVEPYQPDLKKLKALGRQAHGCELFYEAWQ